MAIKIKLPVNQSVGDNDSVNDVDPVDAALDNKMDNDQQDAGDDNTDPIDKKVDNDKSTDSNSDGSNSDEPNPDDQPQVVEIDGSDYTLDDNGNAIDKDGKVFMTSDQLKELENDSDDQSGDDVSISVEDIEKLSGIQLYDAEGKKLTFDLTVEGLAKREKAIKEQAVREEHNKVMDNFFKSNPDLYKAFLHKQKSGSLDGFTSEPFYKSMQIDTNNEQQMMQMIIEAEIKRGRTPEQAKKYAQFAKVENSLDVEGKSAYDYLVQLEDKEFSTYEKTKEESKKQAIESQVKFYGNYYDDNGKEVIVDAPGSIYNKVVTEGRFGNLVIPEDGITINRNNKEVKLSRRELFNYIARPVDQQGRTQAQIDMDNKLSNTDYLLQQYMGNLTGNNFDVFIKRKILEEKSKVIKKRLSSKTTSNSPMPNKNDKKLSLPVK